MAGRSLRAPSAGLARRDNVKMARSGHGVNARGCVIVDGMKAGIGAQVASRLSAPEVLSEGYDRMLAVAQRLQVLVGVIALAAVWALPGDIGRRDQLTVTALLVGAVPAVDVPVARTFALRRARAPSPAS